ncbi:MAG: hypothetical protein GY828_03555 [Candidatus Gracilibacteria bacterium]|nr:hypothetical protein [Candidatus Gracilibacteria bacterium]
MYIILKTKQKQIMENIYRYASEETLKDYLKEIEEGTVEIGSTVKEQVREALEEILTSNK